MSGVETTLSAKNFKVRLKNHASALRGQVLNSLRDVVKRCLIFANDDAAAQRGEAFDGAEGEEREVSSRVAQVEIARKGLRAVFHQQCAVLLANITMRFERRHAAKQLGDDDDFGTRFGKQSV